MTEFIPGEGYRLDIITADDTVIVDSWAGQIKADVIAADGSVQVDTASGKIYGPLIGNIEDITGQVVYDADNNEFKTDVVGDVKNSTGNIIVDTDLGIVNASVFGNLISPSGDVIVDANTKIIEADSIHGTFYGDLVGSVLGDSDFTGNFVGDFSGTGSGDFSGTFTGDIAGDVTGNVIGNVTGNLIGKVMLDESNSLMSEPDDLHNQWDWLGGIAHPLDDPNSTANGPIIVLGEERWQSALKGHVQHYDGTPVLMLDVIGESSYKAQFHGKLRGDVFDADDNYLLMSDSEGVVVTSPRGRLKLGSDDTHSIDVEIKANKIRKKMPIDNSEPNEITYAFRGQSNAPLAVQPLDLLNGSSVHVYNGERYSIGGIWGFIADPDRQVNKESDAYPAGFIVSVSDGVKPPKENLNNALEFRADGSLKVKTLHARGTTFSERDAVPGQEGMIIFNKNSKKFQGFTGTEWVDLH